MEDTYRPVQDLNGREVYFANLELKCHDHYGNAMSQGLIPIGRLRCLRNRFGPAMKNSDHFCKRYYRVNGMKDEQGLWREYPSGRRISFHHFPEFRPLHGGEGDTLIFDALENRLYIDDDKDKYHALCYRDYQKDCEQCAGFETGHECSDAGDCMSNECHCDEGFTGSACQNEPMPPKDFVQIGTYMPDTMNMSAQTFDTLTDGVCSIASYEEFSGGIKGMMCDFAFGKGLCCGGIINTTSILYTDMCGVYDCFIDGWSRFHDLPKKLAYASAAVVKGETGRDMGWLVSGGQENGDGTDLNSLYWLDEHLRWTELDTMMPEAKSYHCSVQINDCEIAIIGGTNATTAIDIYNYKENTWRQGPALDTAPISFTQIACGKLTDQTNYHTYIVIGGIGTYEPRVWDVQTNVITIDDMADPSAYSKQYRSLDENTLIAGNNWEGSIYTYRMDEGFVEMAPAGTTGTTGTTDHAYGSAFLAPRKSTTCM